MTSNHISASGFKNKILTVDSATNFQFETYSVLAGMSEVGAAIRKISDIFKALFFYTKRFSFFSKELILSKTDAQSKVRFRGF